MVCTPSYNKNDLPSSNRPAPARNIRALHQTNQPSRQHNIFDGSIYIEAGGSISTWYVKLPRSISRWHLAFPRSTEKIEFGCQKTFPQTSPTFAHHTRTITFVKHLAKFFKRKQAIATLHKTKSWWQRIDKCFSDTVSESWAPLFPISLCLFSVEFWIQCKKNPGFVAIALIFHTHISYSHISHSRTNHFDKHLYIVFDRWCKSGWSISSCGAGQLNFRQRPWNHLKSKQFVDFFRKGTSSFTQ